MEAGAQEGEIQQGLEAAQKLLEAVVKAGGSRHVVATVAAALRRLTTLPGRAAECSSDEAAAPAQCFRILEEALEVKAGEADEQNEAAPQLAPQEHQGSLL